MERIVLVLSRLSGCSNGLWRNLPLVLCSPTLWGNHSRPLSTCSSSTEGQELRRGPAWSPGSWGGSALGTSFYVCRNLLLPLSSQLFLRHQTQLKGVVFPWAEVLVG